jgi:hypothetical protein
MGGSRWDDDWEPMWVYDPYEPSGTWRSRVDLDICGHKCGECLASARCWVHILQGMKLDICELIGSQKGVFNPQ